ncbi:alpha/beta hydrolase [Pseudomonas sp. PS02288]|uniref:alpha/beta hydrolase n=1 Tax=Pseudomonas sp. PS02288 TaxID=2991443 RepID=UPI00249C3451|nr:alpha/beta hydrolase [Pseudomonas sp. PS02288]
MPAGWIEALKRRWLRLCMLAALLLALPIGCAHLEQKERELVFRVESGTASWYGGLPADVEEMQLDSSDFLAGQNVHAWWWPATREDAPALLYLHGSRWNLTGQLFRIEQLHDLGFSVLAIDYRGFGESPGDLPSERSVNQDARIAWQRLEQLQPAPGKRYIYGHSLGGAVAVDLAEELSQDAEREGRAPEAGGLIIESTFTNLADVAASIAHTSLPIRWILSQKFDSLEKIAQVRLPLLIVHGSNDPYVSPRFSEELFVAANEPKQLLMVEGGTHNNSMRLGQRQYRLALERLLGEVPAQAARTP